MELLTQADIEYMRDTQAHARPTTATHHTRQTTRTPTGGQATTWTGGAPVMVRVDASPDEPPAALAERWEGGSLAKVVCALTLDVHDGDQFRVATTVEGATTTTTYEVVTDGEQDSWATAQIVWARRLNRPVEG